MTGPEVSLLADLGRDAAVARFPAARDYKPIGEGDTGPNTGRDGLGLAGARHPGRAGRRAAGRGPPAGDRRDGAARGARSRACSTPG